MAIVLSLVWAAFFWRDKRTAVIASLAVFSHFLADWPVHNHDLALYPYSEAHLGYGLWERLGNKVFAVCRGLRLGTDRVRRMAEKQSWRLLQVGRVGVVPALCPDVSLALADEIRGAAIGAGSSSYARRAGDDRLPVARPDSDLARQPR